MRQVAAAVLLVLALGCGDGNEGSTHKVERVTLVGNSADGTKGQGWNLESKQIANSADADFRLSIRQVISLFPNQPNVGFCEQRPGQEAGRFEHVEEVPSDLTSCTNWNYADLGGNSNLINNGFAGLGFIVRDRNAVPVAKVMTVSASIDDSGVRVTFDIVDL